MAGSVVLTPATVSVSPGSDAVCVARIRNNAAVVDQFTFTVLGDASAWATVTPPVVSLFPGAETTVEIRFSPPRSSAVPSGVVAFGVRAVPREDPDGSVVEEGVVEVGAFGDIEARVRPRTSEGKRMARHEVTVENRGNCPEEVEIVASDPDERLAFDVRPGSLAIDPGETRVARVKVMARDAFLRGSPKPRPFQIEARPSNAPPVILDATMTQRPGMPRWVVPAVAAVAIVAVGALALPLAQNASKDDRTLSVKPGSTDTPVTLEEEEEESAPETTVAEEAPVESTAPPPPGGSPPPAPTTTARPTLPKRQAAPTVPGAGPPLARPKPDLPVLYPSFESDTDEEIWATNADGSGKRKLTDFPAPQWSVSPTWNWQGTLIAFTHSAGATGPVHIWVMGPGGENPRDVTPDRAITTAQQPAWSPDGKRLAFSRVTGGKGDIWVIDIDAAGNGSNARPLVATPPDEGNPTWSADGTRVAFDRDVGSGTYDIFSVAADGGAGEIRMTEGAGSNRQPAWSPNGELLLFTSTRDSGDREVYVMNADGSSQTRITNVTGIDEFPRWGPDSARFAFATTRFRCTACPDGPNSLDVVVADLAGNVKKQLTAGSGRHWMIGWV